MKKSLKAMFFLILLTIIISMILYSCKSNNENTAKIQDITDHVDSDFLIATEIKDSLPDDIDFGGKNLNILIMDFNDTVGWGIYEFVAEEETGDSLNDAVYNRNKTVEDLLSTIKI